MAVAKREIKRIGVFSAVKTLFLLGGFGGFVLGIVKWAFLSMILWSLGRSGLGVSELMPELDNLFGVGMGMLGFVMPLAGAMIGAVGGVVGGFLFAGVYNLSARLWGGLEIELAEMATASPSVPAATRPQRYEPTPLPGGPQPQAAPPADEPRRDDSAEGPPPPSFE